MATKNLASKSSKPIFLEFRSSKGFVAFAISYAVFVDQVLCTAVLPVVPYSLSYRAGVSQNNVPRWNAAFIAFYGFAASVISLPWGHWSDRNPSRQTPFIIGLFALLGSTLLIWLGPDLPLQILARILGGVASSVVYISGCAIMVDTVGTRHVAEWMGWVSMALCVGSMAGPLMGGVIFAEAGYDAVFGLLVGLIVIDIALRLTMVERHTAVQWIAEESRHKSDDQRVAEPADQEKQVSDRSSEEGVMVEALPLPDTVTTDLESAAPETLGSTSRSQLRYPAIIYLLTSQRLLVAAWYTIVLATIFSSFQAVLAVYVQHLWNWNALGAELIFLPLTIPSLAAPLIGKVSDRFGARWLMFAGFICMCPLLTLLLLVNANATSQKVLLCVLLGLIGLAINFVLDPLFGEYISAVEEVAEDQPAISSRGGAYAQAYGLFNLAWAVGDVGSLWAALINERYGWSVMAWSLGLLSGVTSVLALLPRKSKTIPTIG